MWSDSNLLNILKASSGFNKTDMSNPRASVYLPYVEEIVKLDSTRVKMVYKGGEVVSDLTDILSIMLYNSKTTLSTEVIDFISAKGIPIIIHRKHKPTCTYIMPSNRADANDVLSKQIMYRQDKHKVRHIARQLLRAKFTAMDWLLTARLDGIKYGMTLEELRQLEAQQARMYWERYYETLGVQGNRRSINNISFILNAVSKYITGNLLRWVTYHHLSPYHGFLHEPTTYPSLIYDLIEPYRGYYEKQVCEVIKEQLAEQPNIEKEKLLGIVINDLRDHLRQKVYSELTRQIVYRQELLHGIVLSLRSYLLGETKRFLIPMENKPNGGRPKKVTFKMYGKHAGITNTFKHARDL